MAMIFELLYWVLSVGLNFYMMLLVIYALLSWVPAVYQTWLGQTLARICEPYLKWFRFLDGNFISFAPALGLVLLYIVQQGLLKLLVNLMLVYG